MSSANSGLLAVTKKQYIFKLKSCSGFFLSLVVAQLIGILFSISGQGGRMSTYSGTYKVDIYMLYSTPTFIFTLICAVACAIYLNTKEYKNADFTFISNRLSSNLSNIMFLFTYIAVGSVTTGLSAVFLRTTRLLITGPHNIMDSGFTITPVEILCSMGVTFLYVLLSCSAAYFCMVLINKSKWFMLLILALVVLVPRTDGFKEIAKKITLEQNFTLFMLKVAAISVILVASSLLISNNQEVRR